MPWDFQPYLGGGGKLYRHGGKKKGSHCPGSDQLPSFTQAPQVLGTSGGIPVSGGSGSSGVNNHTIPDGPDFEADLDFLLHSSKPLLIEHIPKCARPACSALLTSLLNKVCSDPSNPGPWIDLLAFGPAILYKPYRGGRRSNVGKLVKNRVSEFKGRASVPDPVVGSGRHKLANHEDNLAAAVTTKIEQGNLKAAVRMLLSDEQPAPPTTETVDMLRAKHPSTPDDRRPTLEDTTDCLSVGNAEVLKAIMVQLY